MGFLRRLFATKKSTATSSSAPAKRRWSFVREKVRNSTAFNDSKLNASTSQLDTYDADGIDANKRAIAVAAATAVVAEAALAAAHAAAEVVRLTSGKGAEISASTAPHLRVSRHFSAIKIQSAFRGYLARRALKALKALVKLQALVRGHIVRKQTADMLRRIQTLVRVQSRVSASRTLMSDSSRSCTMSSLSSHPVHESPHKMGHQYRTYSNKYDGPSILKRCGSNSNFRDAVNLEKERLGTNWLDHWMEENLWSNCNDTSKRYGHSDDEKSDKILEVDTWKPHLDSQRGTPTFQTPRRVRTFEYNNQSFMTLVSPSQRSTKAPYPNTNQPLLDVLSMSSLKLSSRKESGMRTTGNSPHAFSASSRPGSARRGSFTPSRNEHSMCYFNGYSGYPNYMANTESSRAKVRSQSVPRQRLELEKYSTSRSVQGSWDARARSSKGFIQDADHSSSNSLNKLGISRLR